MAVNYSRSPRGERGLKYDRGCRDVLCLESLPTRGAWIEISFSGNFCSSLASLPTRGAWIEIQVVPYGKSQRMSLPTRGAWIEMPCIDDKALRIGCRSPRGERGLKS